MARERSVMMFLPPEAKILMILKCIRTDFKGCCQLESQSFRLRRCYVRFYPPLIPNQGEKEGVKPQWGGGKTLKGYSQFYRLRIWKIGKLVETSTEAFFMTALWIVWIFFTMRSPNIKFYVKHAGFRFSDCG